MPSIRINNNWNYQKMLITSQRSLLLVISLTVWDAPYWVIWRGAGGNRTVLIDISEGQEAIEMFWSTSVPILTVNIRGFSSSSVLWELEVLCCPFSHSSSLIGHSMSGGWLLEHTGGLRSALGKWFWLAIVPPVHRRTFPVLNQEDLRLCRRLHFGICCAIPRWESSCYRVPESYLNRVNMWCVLSGMKLNASKIKTTIVSKSCTIHPQSTPLTLEGTVLKESADLVILGVTFDAN